MSMDRIYLFYEIRNLFNTSKDAFDIFGELKARIYYNRQYEFGSNILLIFPTRECKDRTYKKCLSKTNFSKLDDYILKDLENTYIFYSIEEKMEMIMARGIRFTSIRFLG